MNGQPFLYTGGHFINSVSVARRDVMMDKPYCIDMGNSILSMSPETAVSLLIGLAEVLYDNGDMTIEAADRMQYLSGSVIVDSVAAAEKCPNCNGNGDTGPGYDPDPCNACRGTGWRS